MEVCVRETSLNSYTFIISKLRGFSLFAHKGNPTKHERADVDARVTLIKCA